MTKDVKGAFRGWKAGLASLLLMAAAAPNAYGQFPGGVPAGAPPGGGPPGGGIPPGAPPGAPAGLPVGPNGGPPANFEPPPLPALPKDAPKPSPDPHNLEGTWYHHDALELNVAKTMYGHPVPMNDAGKAILAKRAAQQATGHPYAYAAVKCVPPGQSWQVDINFPFTILQNPKETVFLFEEFHGAWTIRMNAHHRATHSYMGDSVGHWDGDTLVVDTIGFKKLFWVDNDITGGPISANGHVIFRIRKIDQETGPALEIISTYDDPAYYTAKWSTLRTFVWRPDKDLFQEYNCEQQVTAEDALSSYGYVPDPYFEDSGSSKKPRAGH